MNRRDALKTFAAVAAGGSLPVATREQEIAAFLGAAPFNPEIFAIARRIEDYLGTHVRVSSDPLIVLKRKP